MLPQMDDYSPQAKIYWWTTVLLGAAALLLAMRHVALFETSVLLQIALGAAIAALTGMLPVTIPGSKTSFVGAEIFVFLLLLIYGPAAAAIAAASEAAVGSWRTSDRWTSRIGSPAMAALAMYGCGTGYVFATSRLTVGGDPSFVVAFALLLILALAYFAAGTLLMASLITLKRGEPVRPLEILREHGWLGLVYAASASISELLYVSFDRFGPAVLLVATPIIAMFLSTLHFYFRHAEVNQRAQQERVAAAERAAADNAKHLAELRESEDRFHSAFTHAAVGMVLVSTDGRILQANAALARLVGKTEAELVGAGLATFVSPEDADLLRTRIGALVSGTEATFATDLRCEHSQGREVWVSLNAAFFSVGPSAARCLILQLQDITARRCAESRLQHIAFHDSLTDLPNRGFFLEQLARAIAAAKRHSDRRYAVLFLDFDRFKLINDSFGHSAGDALLLGLAQRLRHCLRPADLVARMGGDEFAILVEDFAGEREVIQLANRLQTVLGEPVRVGGLEVATSASIGITTSTFGYDSPERVMRDADIAMYRAKEQGKARYALFDSALHAEVTEQLWIEAELRRAIEHRRLDLVYQPIFHLRSKRLAGFEALARWTHPERGPIAPDRFIRIAEETGMIHRLGDWALDTACRQFGVWQRANPGLDEIALHVNVSGAQLVQPDFAANVAEVIAAANMVPAQLTIELTESLLIEKLSAALPNLHHLRDLGVQVSIDDFGTGYSSLSALENLPIGEIKVDRSFVQRLGGAGKGGEVVQAVVALGRSLGKRVIAEGIETVGQFDRLVGLDCERGQGNLLAHPLPAQDIPALIRESRLYAAAA